MEPFDAVLGMLGDEYRDEADAIVLDREDRIGRCLHDGPPAAERMVDHMNQQVWLICKVPGCGRRLLFSAEDLDDLSSEEARKIALERSYLAQTIRLQEIGAEVRTAPLDKRGSSELVAEAKQAVEDRDPEKAQRAVAALMDPRR